MKFSGFRGILGSGSKLSGLHGLSRRAGIWLLSGSYAVMDRLPVFKDELCII